jgi:hypothetical protein
MTRRDVLEGNVDLLDRGCDPPRRDRLAGWAYSHYNDFQGGRALINFTVANVTPNSHAAFGYLRTSAVRAAVSAVLTAPVADTAVHGA